MDPNLLLGGLVIDSERKREFCFKPLTGLIERKIQDSSEKYKSLPDQISEVLARTLKTVAGLPVNREVVESLCTGDRQYLMLKLHELVNPAPEWITCNCVSCNERIQFLMDFRQLPVKEAGTNYPRTDISYKDISYSLRVPTGNDETLLAENNREKKLSWTSVLKHLLSTGDDFSIDNLEQDEISKLDSMLDDMTPQIASSVQVSCPYCETDQHVFIDHYGWLGEVKEIDREVHELASHYHWSEQEILSLSRNRRKRYLAMINRSSGRYSNARPGVDPGGVM